MPSSRRRTLGWGPLVRFILLLALMLPPWSAVGRWYGRAVGAWAQLTLTEAAAPVELRFAAAGPSQAGADPWSLAVEASDPDDRYVRTTLDTRRSGYLASAFFLALSLATPCRWRKKLALTIAGLSLLALLPLLPLIFFFSGKLPVQAFHPGSVAAAAVETAYHALVAPPGMAYAVPTLLWLLLWWCTGEDVLRLLPPTWAAAAASAFRPLRSRTKASPESLQGVTEA